LAKAGAWKLAALLLGAYGLARRRAGQRKPPALGEVRSILAIRLDLLGDLVFTLPAIEALREAMPKARLSVLALPYTAGLLRGHPAVDRVIPVDVNRWRRPGEWAAGRAPRQMVWAVAELRRERYDIAISFYGRVGASAALLSGARYLVGYEAEGYPSTFDLAVAGRRYRKRRHEAEYCLDLVRALGLQTNGKPPRLTVDPAAAAAVERLLSDAGLEVGEKPVALHPGALNMAAKRWLPERWAAVADRVQRDLGRRVLLVGAASELPLVEQVLGRMATLPVVLVGKTSVAELVALLSRCSLFLGCDSGPLHVASALGVPSVSVYGPTDPAITGPLGARGRVLRAGAGCSPCYDPMNPSACRQSDYLCMAGVSVDQVFEAAREVICHA
jgi:lipopolysaccharide heptosyltransferase II